MDQVKEILKQLIKYRFWIAVGISALLPMIAYAVGSGPVKDQSKKKTDEILGAKKGVEQFTNGVLPNDQYKTLVDKKTNVLNQDVEASWRKLYDRQKGLLTWPDIVSERFETWGRKWPENVDPSSVRLAIIDYVTEYPKYVTKVYQTFRPFDLIEGTGVVAAPPEALLLKPAPFKEDTPPELGKVWAAQERLWIQRTLLEVIAEVNKNAKDWDTAIVRAVNAIEVGNSLAQDQISIGKGDELVEADPITAPGAPAPEAEEPAGGPMGMMPMMGGGMGKPEDVENVLYIKSPSDQYKILPVHMSVLIDQNHIQDLLVALENSPMTIQVVEFDMSRPNTRVTKPEKGANMNFGMMGMGMMGMMGRGRMMGMGSMSGYGGMMSAMSSRMAMMGPMMSGSMYSMGGSAVEERKGVDKRQENRGEKLKKEQENAAKVVTQSIHDPYYYVVEVTIYGQARFYNAPPAPKAAEESQAEGAPADEASKDETKAEGAPADEAKKAEGAPADAAKAVADPPKAEAEAPAKNEAAAKAEGPAPEPKAEPAKTEEAPKNAGGTPDPKSAPADAKAEAPKASAPTAPASKP